MVTAQINQLPGNPGTEGGRRPTDVPGNEQSRPDVEVVVKRTHRRLSVGFKTRVIKHVLELRETGRGSVGEYLRKEGLYYTDVRRWMKQQTSGRLKATKSGTKPQGQPSLRQENQKLRRQLSAMEKKLKKTELIVELQKKISQLLEIDQSGIDEKP